mgnify:FL=1
MKRRRCTSCKHKMKGHKKKRCKTFHKLILPDGSVYSGAVYDNKPSGRGRLNSEDFTYEGEFLNGERHGEGEEIKENGSTYSGHWMQNTYHGFGKLVGTGFIYEGMFRRNRYHGKGTYTEYLPGGQKTVYIGQFSQHSKHGKGKHILETGTYEGNFYYNMRHGNGTFTYASGDIYSGHWRRGIEHGTGMFTSSEETYTGGWVRGKRHGHGRWNSVYHGNYNGGWKRGFRHGKGVHIYKTGEKYEGGFSCGERTGFGVLSGPNGELIYSGFWLKDVYNGRGTLVQNGISFKGTWEDGNREGVFEEVSESGCSMIGPWTNDLRHGTFQKDQQKKLYLWNQETSFKRIKDARSASVRMINKHDYQTATAIFKHYPTILSWSFLYKHDHRGIFLHMLPENIISKYIHQYIWKCYKMKKYVFLEHLVACLSESKLDKLLEIVPELFDALTKNFVPNPWIVNHNSYSESTKQKLLEGLHLGEFGRCEPKDPFTRLVLNENSGKYLDTDKRLSQQLYKKFAAAVSSKTSIEQLAYVYNIQDFEELLKNAREADDKVTVLRLMKERNLFISESLRHR